jgi:hypothetical protein
MTGQVIRASKTTAVRYERSRPGELVHMDVKKLARIPDGGGWRAHGRAAREATLRELLQAVERALPVDRGRLHRCDG